MIRWEDIIDIVETKDRKQQNIYRVIFKHDKSNVKNGMALSKTKAETKAYNWVRKNQDKAHDILFELEVLMHAST